MARTREPPSRDRRRSVAGAILALLWFGASAAADPCANCFAVFILPDTQWYTHDLYFPQGANHLDLIGRYICANRDTWTEPDTGKEMPIAMVINTGDMTESAYQTPQWQRIDQLYGHLDGCGVHYLAIHGNHDLSRGTYHHDPTMWQNWFGVARYNLYQCSDPANCDLAAGEWFIGGGDPILAFSRNNADLDPGPPRDVPGRHRAAIIELPSRQPMLFMGLDLAFDFPPAATPQEEDDSAWIKRVFADYAGVPTLLFSHTMIDMLGRWEDDNNFDCDSYTSMLEVWNEIVDPFPQVFMTVNGHRHGDGEHDITVTTSLGRDVLALFRNYQGDAVNGYGNRGTPGEKNGWQAIAVFDPDEQEIRIRSYRIEDTDDDGTHDGVPEDTAYLDTNFLENPDVTFSYDFRSLKACEDNIDNDGDGATDLWDAGCQNSGWFREDPECDDGVDNDGDGRIDLDDPQCAHAWQISESPSGGCGLGFELVLIVPWILNRWSRPRGRRERAGRAG